MLLPYINRPAPASNRRRRRAIACGILPALLCAALPACSLKRTVVRASTPMLADALQAFEREGDWELAEQAYPAQLKLLDGMLVSDPGNHRLLVMAARGYATIAFGFLETRALESGAGETSARLLRRAAGFYLRGMDYARRALPLLPQARRSSDGSSPGDSLEALRGASWEDILPRIGKRDAPALFWLAYAWGAWINLHRDDMRAVADLPRALAAIQRVGELDPNFFFGGVHMFTGVYWCNRPRMLGGDPEKGRRIIERASALTGGDFLMPKLLLAEYCAVNSLDRDAFDRLIGEILSAPEDLFPEQRLANVLVKRRARALKARVDQLF